MSLLTSWNFGGYAEAVYERKALLTYRHQSAHQGKFLLLAFGSFEDPIRSLLLALKDEPCTCSSAIVIYLYHYQPLCVFKTPGRVIGGKPFPYVNHYAKF